MVISADMFSCSQYGSCCHLVVETRDTSEHPPVQKRAPTLKNRLVSIGSGTQRLRSHDAGTMAGTLEFLG